MNFKFLFITILTGIISISAISCSSDNAKTQSNRDGARILVNKETFVPARKLPQGASSLNNLPSNIKGFVERNYSGYIITIAVSDPLCGGGDAVDVAISKIGLPDLSLIFKPDGTFVQKEQDVPLNTVTLAIIQTLKARYSDYSTAGQVEKLTLADNTEEYLVDLSKGAKSKEVILNTNGTVVCEN